MQDDDSLPLSWRQRPRPVGQEMVYRLHDGELEVDSGRKSYRIRLAAIERVRFFYAPSNVTSNAFRTQLTLADRRTVTFGNLSWRSMTDVERDDARYHAFVSGLSAAIVRANPQVHFVAGRNRVFWLALAIAGVAAMLMLTWFSVSAFRQGATAAGWLGIAFAALSAWQVIPMVRLNRPRELAAGTVPPDLVPGG
jgi:hypothetical protein